MEQRYRQRLQEDEWDEEMLTVIGLAPIRESMVKLNNTEIVDRVPVQVFGGMGVLTEGPVERIYRFVRMLRIVEGTLEIQRPMIARSLGL